MRDVSLAGPPRPPPPFPRALPLKAPYLLMVVRLGFWEGATGWVARRCLIAPPLGEFAPLRVAIGR